MLGIFALALVSSKSILTDDVRLCRYAAVHGDRVVFSYAADLWLWTEGGGPARRLTSSPGIERNARFSPDGTKIAFTASYDGNPEVYVMPAEGGEPKRLTYEPEADTVVGWTPDGRIAYLSSSESHVDNQPRLWMVSPEGGLPLATPLFEANGASFSPDGTTVAYQRAGGNNMNWRQYRGGDQPRISLYNLKTNAYSELPNTGESAYSPLWIGNAIYYLSDRDNEAVNLFRFDLGSKKNERLTDFREAAIKEPSTDGKSIVFERDGLLYRFDVASKKLDRLRPTIDAEKLAARPTLKRVGNEIKSLSVSSTEDAIAVEARGEIFTIEGRTGDAVDLTRTSDARDRFPRYAPDGKSIAFVSDRTGESELFTIPSRGGGAAQITNGQGSAITALGWSPDSSKIAFTNRSHQLKIIEVGTKQTQTVAADRLGVIPSFDWSPDGKWLAYVDWAGNGNNVVVLYEVATGKRVQVTGGDYSDSSVAFDPGGRYLYIVSNRVINTSDGTNLSEDSLKQKPYALLLTEGVGSPVGDEGDRAARAPGAFKIDFEGLSTRIVPLPFEPDSYDKLFARARGLVAVSANGVQKFDVSDDNSQPVIAGNCDAVDCSADGSKVAYLSGTTLGLVNTKGPHKIADGRVATTQVEFTLDPVAEWKQIFWEAWRYERDNFYDKNMKGLDWKAIGDHYATLLPYVAHRSDLTYLLGLMISDLRTSHGFVSEGDPWISQPGIPVGRLGVDYEASGEYVRFKRVYRGSHYDPATTGPLGQPGVRARDGDYLLEIDGQPVNAHINPLMYLVDKVGKRVTLTLNDHPGMEGSWQVRVKPIASESLLRYFEWVEANRRYVDKASGGRIGYMHVKDTLPSGASGLVDGYYRNVDKEALIVDARNNHGGSEPTSFVNKLSERTMDAVFQRYHDAGLGRFVNGPKAMLTNGHSASAGDLFPYLFRKAKLGPVIGTRTWGGTIGMELFYPLVDGGTITAPAYALFDPDTGEWIAENKGVIPDIEVDERPDMLAQGRDMQLEKAVDYLLDQLKKHGPRKVLHPAIKKIGG